MSGYRNSAGVDFDNLFDPDVMGDGYVATFLRNSSGQGLHYAAAKYGTPGPTVGFRDNTGADVGPKWAAKGTANYGGPVANPGYGNMQGIASQSHGSGNSTASVTMLIWGNGTWSDSAQSGQPGSGNWYSPTTSNIGVSYYVKIIFTKTTGNGFGALAINNIGPVLIGTGDQQASASLTFGAGGVATASASGTCQVIISTDAAQNNVVSNQTCNWNLQVDIV